MNSEYCCVQSSVFSKYVEHPLQLHVALLVTSHICHLSAQAVDQWPLAELMLRVISRIIHERTFPKYFQSDVHMCSGVPNRVLLDYL